MISLYIALVPTHRNYTDDIYRTKATFRKNGNYGVLSGDDTVDCITNPEEFFNSYSFYENIFSGNYDVFKTPKEALDAAHRLKDGKYLYYPEDALLYEIRLETNLLTRNETLRNKGD